MLLPTVVGVLCQWSLLGRCRRGVLLYERVRSRYAAMRVEHEYPIVRGDDKWLHGDDRLGLRDRVGLRGERPHDLRRPELGAMAHC
jgi:hypothetical protein